MSSGIWSEGVIRDLIYPPGKGKLSERDVNVTEAS